jgi:hypothetical protein
LRLDQELDEDGGWNGPRLGEHGTRPGTATAEETGRVLSPLRLHPKTQRAANFSSRGAAITALLGRTRNEPTRVLAPRASRDGQPRMRPRGAACRPTTIPPEKNALRQNLRLSQRRSSLGEPVRRPPASHPISRRPLASPVRASDGRKGPEPQAEGPLRWR